MLFVGTAFAQKTVTGNITSEADKLSLPGVNVTVKGTTTGTVTDGSGNFTIKVPNNKAVLLFSFIGFESKEVVVGEQTKINIALKDESAMLENVVVTALGIKREKKALGYSVAEVNDKAFESSKSSNPMASLSGRMAGVQISSTAQGPGSSTSVIIRGTKVADGSNEPLYVVDGIPISNTNFTSGDHKQHGGIDSGNGMSGIAADDIENISILKGAAATALYGSRAINGVVMITTKSGKGSKGTTIDFTSSTTFDQARIYNDWQKSYGQGNYGKAPSNQQESHDNTSMWGASYKDVTSYTDYKGAQSDYRFYDNERDFNRIGKTFSNSIAVNHNTETSVLRFSYSNLNNSGIVPNTEYNRNNITLSGSTKAFNNKLEINAKISYVAEKSSNKPIGESPFTASLIGTPNNVPLSSLRNYKDKTTGLPVGFGNKNTNIYWNLYEINHNYDKDRILTSGEVKYTIIDNLKAMVRYGNDHTIFDNSSLYPIGTPYYEKGRVQTVHATDSETNIDGMLTFDKNFGKWGLTVNAGASIMQKKYDALESTEESFNDPALQRPGFGATRTIIPNYFKKQINSVFGTAQFNYNSFLFVDLSARNDWSSTLPQNNNSYFYPSVSSSLIFSELFDKPSWFSFGKIRASWAQVGSDTDPYQLNLIYEIGSNKVPGNGGDATSGNINGSTIPNKNLKPSINESYEVGLELKFFNNRLGADVSYYKSKATNQIVKVSTSTTSGFEKAIINAGAIQNAGVELSIYATPISTKNFSWNSTFNYAYNKNKVIDLTEGVPQITLYETSSVNVIAKPGEPYGQIIGTTYKRDNTGKILLDDNGKPMASDELHTIGNAYHKTMLGWINQFNYKNFTATFAIDGKFGGKLYSNTEAAAYSSGKHKSTLQRENYVEGQVWYPKELGGIGTTAKPQDLFGAISSIDEQFIYDASYLSVQEINLTYHLPASLISKMKVFKGISAGFYVRNLGYLWKATDNIDPQATYSIANGGGGVEMGSLAIPRNYGINLNFKF